MPLSKPFIGFSIAGVLLFLMADTDVPGPSQAYALMPGLFLGVLPCFVLSLRALFKPSVGTGAWGRVAPLLLTIILFFLGEFLAEIPFLRLL